MVVVLMKWKMLYGLDSILVLCFLISLLKFLKKLEWTSHVFLKRIHELKKLDETKLARICAIMRRPKKIIAIISSFLTPFMSSAINVALPAIGNEFLTNAILLSWIPTSFLLASAIFAVSFGRIADIYGMKKIFFYGMVIFTISSFLCVVAFSDISLIAFRIIQGIGTAIVFVTGLTLVTSVYPPQERGKAIDFTI